MIIITNDEIFTKRVYKALAISIAVTLFLFFIDEGYYNFNWMADVGNWVAFLIYVVLLLIPQLVLIYFFGRIETSGYRNFFLYIIGVVLGIAAAFYLLS